MRGVCHDHRNHRCRWHRPGLCGSHGEGRLEVLVSNSRGPESLAEVVSQLGPRARAGTRQEAAQADVVVVAVQREQLRAALSDLPAWNGRILIDATNPVVQPGFRLANLNGCTSSEIVASLVPGTRVVK